MINDGTPKKRFYKSHIFRIAVFAAALFCTVFFPMMFAYPHAKGGAAIVIAVCVSCAAVAETVVFAVITHVLVYRPLEFAAQRFNSMPFNGNTDKVDHHAADNAVGDILSAVNATAAEYKRLEHVRKTFVSNASHELRSPLTSVQGFLQAVLDGTATADDAEKYLKIAFSETKRLNTLINSMLDLSRLDSGKNPLVWNKFDLNDVINEIIVRFEPSLGKKQLHINTDFARPSCYVYADKDKIIQVITNLIDNAIKYSPAYSRVIITTEIRDSKVFVSVRDFGYGISKKDQMLIWDTFFMSDKSRSPVKTKGSGLGLSIVKKIIDEHGEVVWVDSNRGAGATFIFSLTLFDPSKHKIATGKIITAADEALIDAPADSEK